MDAVNHNVSLSLHPETSEERKVISSFLMKDDSLSSNYLFHDKICSTVPMGPLSPTAATDDSSQTDIGNVLSLEVPDTPSNGSRSTDSEAAEDMTVVSNDWNLVHVSDPEKPIVLETINIVDSIPSDMDSNPPQHPADMTLFPAQDDSPQETVLATGDLQELRRLQQDEAIKESNKEPFDPMRMLRKGGVAVLGGTMVGVGLIMIPLPTPFGVVVASSGMAVLSAEFEGAKVLNQKITETTKKHWDAARDHIIKNIEEMEGTGRPSTIHGPENNGSNDLAGDGESLKDDAIDATDDNGGEEKQEDDTPQRKNTQPNLLDQWKRSTGAYLSRHLVPILKRCEVEVASVPDADVTVQSETETISDMEQGDDLANDSNGIAANGDDAVVPVAQQ